MAGWTQLRLDGNSGYLGLIRPQKPSPIDTDNTRSNAKRSALDADLSEAGSPIAPTLSGDELHMSALARMERMMEQQTAMISQVVALSKSQSDQITELVNIIKDQQQVMQQVRQIDIAATPGKSYKDALASNLPQALTIAVQVDRAASSHFSADSEVSMRKEKVNNAVIVNWIEHKRPTSVSEKDRSNSNRDPSGAEINPELRYIKGIVHEQGGDPNTIKEVFRLGKLQQGRPRPVKVKCSSPMTKNMILRSASQFSPPPGDNNKSFVRHDLTDKQRKLCGAAKEVLNVVREVHKDRRFILRDVDSGGTPHIYERMADGAVQYHCDPFNDLTRLGYTIDFNKHANKSSR